MSSVTSSEQTEVAGTDPSDSCCPQCGEILESPVEFCPGCGGYVEGDTEVAGTAAGDGARDRARIGSRVYAGIGLVTGVASFLVLPILLGPVTVFCGVQLFRQSSETVGLGILLLGAVGTGAGLLAGPIAGL